jgi:hypothetical protein
MADVQILQLLLKLSCDSKKKQDNPLHAKGCAMTDVQILDKDWVAKSKPLFWLDKDWVVKSKPLFWLVQIFIRIQTPVLTCTDS